MYINSIKSVKKLFDHSKLVSPSLAQNYVNEFFRVLDDVIIKENSMHPKKKLLSTTQFDHDETVKIRQRIIGTGTFYGEE